MSVTIGAARPHRVTVSSASCGQVAEIELFAADASRAGASGLRLLATLWRAMTGTEPPGLRAEAVAYRRDRVPGIAEHYPVLSLLVERAPLPPASRPARTGAAEIREMLLSLEHVDPDFAAARDDDYAMVSLEAKADGTRVHVRVSADLYHETGFPYSVDSLGCAQEGTVLALTALAGLLWRDRRGGDMANCTEVIPVGEQSATLRAASLAKRPGLRRSSAARIIAALEAEGLDDSAAALAIVARSPWT